MNKLNLGCGYDHRVGYLNIDMHASVNPDLVADILDLKLLPSATYDEIVAQDVLEHFRWCETTRALLEWNRLLKLHGTLFLRVPYIIGLAKRFESALYQDIPTQKLLVINLFSQQLMPGDYHLTIFTERLIRYYLWETGYDIVSITVLDEWLFEIHARKLVEYYDFNTLSPNLNNIEFLERVYKTILGREPDADGLETWCDKLSSGQIDRESMIRAALLSPEREQKMALSCPNFKLLFDKPR